MDATHRDIGQEPGWDARVPVDTMIEAATYALLKGSQVVLVAKTTDTSLHGVVLTNEQGLHYDGDSTISKEYAQEKLQEGDWAVTQEWQTVEDWIRQ